MNNAVKPDPRRGPTALFTLHPTLNDAQSTVLCRCPPLLATHPATAGLHQGLGLLTSLLLLGEERLANLAGRAAELDADNALELAEQCLVGRRAAGLEVGDLGSAARAGWVRAPCGGVLTSCGLAFTAVASSFCVMDFPSAFFLFMRAVARALPTLGLARSAGSGGVGG
jgi:hypothetical protein